MAGRAVEYEITGKIPNVIPPEMPWRDIRCGCNFFVEIFNYDPKALTKIPYIEQWKMLTEVVASQAPCRLGHIEWETSVVRLPEFNNIPTKTDLAEIPDLSADYDFGTVFMENQDFEELGIDLGDF